MLVPRTFDNRRCFLGESPRWDPEASRWDPEASRWDPEASRLVWIDILAGRILTRSLHSASRASVTASGEVSQLFMTTGASGMAEKDLLDQPAAGFVFVLDVPQAPADPAFYPG